MSNLVTLSAITLAAQQRADRVNGNYITASEWTNMVNSSCQMLWEKLVEAYGSDYEVQLSTTFTTDGQADRYALPSDFFKLLGVDLQISPGASSSSNQGWVTVWRFNMADRNKYTLPNIQTFYGRTNLRYRLSGGTIFFIPLPSSGQLFRLWYAPKMPIMVAPTDTFDDVNGWTEWVVNDVAMKARVKDESSIDDLMKLQAMQEERLTHVIDNRDASQPATTVDILSANGGWYGDGSGRDWGY